MTDTTGRTDLTGTPGTAPVDPTGTLDEALERLHAAGPERNGWLSNHGPMAVEALVRHGQAPAVHRWLDHYSHKLEDMPTPAARVTAKNWHEALGDPRRIADWTMYFEQETAERPWQDVLTEWWPRLLPGIAAGATHPVIRVGHAVRTLLDGEANAPRIAELAHGLGYWAARHQPLPALKPPASPVPAPSAAAALDSVPPVADQSGGIRDRLAQLTAFPLWPQQFADDPDVARARLAELVRAATHRYATHGHGEPIMLVHAATAPNAVLRTLPALPRDLWHRSLAAAWAASAAVTAAYSPADPVPGTASPSPALRGRDLRAGGGARRRPHDQVHRHRTGRRGHDGPGRRAPLDRAEPAGPLTTQPNCTDRFASPIQNPSMTLRRLVELALRRAQRHEERREVLGTRVGQPARRGLVLEVEQRVDVLRVQRPVAPVVELRRPAGVAAARVPQRGEVVGEEAAADDQYALVAQRRELAADLHQLLRVERRHGDLEDGDVGAPGTSPPAGRTRRGRARGPGCPGPGCRRRAAACVRTRPVAGAPGAAYRTW